ncbi:hypothetical protein LV85_04051 [Algoriphagus chordae]|uniref:Uncharacterized protein n=2 Tax=Algoriphagus chordae TaxID=237019 RepID=A0A2W7QFR5_9BACT|nr:hypothetical protein LV85_04051 [Algoriphagus chordae]
MKKLLIGLAFSFICFSGFALELPPYNACGAENVASMVMQIEQNLCEGEYEIHDICDLDANGDPHEYHVTMSYDGPNSSCGGLPVLP